MKIATRTLWTNLISLTLATLLVMLSAGADAAVKPVGKTKAVHQVKAKKALRPVQVASLRHLRQLLNGKNVQVSQGGIEMMRGGGLGSATGGPLVLATTAGAADTTVTKTAHSTTNTQVAGVDEGDIVKTDGDYIYSLHAGQIRIVKAYPADQMTLVASIKLDDGFYANELYVEGDRLVVIGNGWLAAESDPAQPTESAPAFADKFAIWAPMGESVTFARVYDIADRAQPKVEREVSFSGNYLTSRKIGDSVYLLGRTYPMIYWMAARFAAPAATEPVTSESTLPKVRDSAVNDGASQTLPINRLYYFPGFVDPDYVVIAGFRLSRPDLKADVKSFLGAGEVAYASQESIYLSAADYRVDASGNVPDTVTSRIYRFGVNNGTTQFRSGGEVPGTVLNQFSMDAHGGYFRVATNVNNWVQVGDVFQNQSWNNVYNLNDDMKIVGRLEKLAEGERIFSARFMGDRAYLVTFRQVDPLFVIDLATPDAPKVLGELKIPGFSNYLHPYDDNHIIGIGQETVDDNGFVRMAGLKLALFDVTDVTKPSLMHSTVIGAQGSSSDVLYDHKALLFDKASDRLALPVQEMAVVGEQPWPVPVFQGAKVFNLTLDGGFKELASISHQDAGNVYDWNHYVRRMLTIADQFYTVSEGRIQANDGSTFKETGRVDIAPPVYGPLPVDPLPVDVTSCVAGDVCVLAVDPAVSKVE